jgi:hypothetical protein
MAIDGTVSIGFVGNDRRTVGINTGANLGVNFQPSITYADGVGANQANVLYQASLALTAGVNNVDLSGVLTDSYGTSLTPARIKAWAFQNNSATNSMTVGNGTNPWVTCLTGTGTLIIPAGGFFVFATPDATGWTVTAATGDILKVAGTGTDAFTLIFFGGKT